ncbi:TetR/AcrR family transcriptional regulator [Nocardia brasiliensis]|uniref:TetR/AcrR family transcriptional regulator n=1 Tax=Nocardia brasiliensis TaxID=37326 RepID=UPI002457EF7F|nr:TetR/AcrR family transcriptional regulator [Nocardia brasiliensis]
MAARRVLTRAESQAQTRDELIEAAQTLFYADGYFTTSLAAIAAEAGRTIGAVYSNFENKGMLCTEVLRSWATGRLGRLTALIAGTDGSLDERKRAIATWWNEGMAQRAPMVLAAEYAISVIREPGQTAAAVEMCERFVESGRELLLEHLPEHAAENTALLQDAVRGILATGVGLAVGNVADVIGPEESSAILTTTMEFWLQRLGESLPSQPI